MTNHLHIRQAKEEDLPKIYDLLKTLYGWTRPVDFIRWQCFDTIIPAILVCGYYNDELIGMAGIQKRTLSNNSTCGQASWLNIAPHWQRKGLFSELGEAALGYFSDLDVICVFANAAARVPCEKALGMKTIGSIKMMVLNSPGTIKKPGTFFTVHEIGRNSMFPTFSEEESGTISFKYTQSYRLWRYAMNPMYTYHLIVLITGEYAVVKLFKDPLTKDFSGDIVDFECPQTKKGRVGELLNAVCWFLKEKKVDKITTWATKGREDRRVIESLGFKESNSESYFGFKSLKTEYDCLNDFTRWHLRQADATNY